MTDREKLVNLLFEWGNKENDGVMAESIADYLLANGVIVPPCKVGDTVYGISRGVIVPVGIDAIQYTHNGIKILGRNERYWGNSTITLDVDNKIGIEWYFTKEEAEKALEEIRK